MVQGLNSCQSKRFFSSPEYPDQLWGPFSLLFNGYLGSLPEVKRPECEINHSSPSSAEVKNKWCYTSTSPICLQGVYRENFTFFYQKRNCNIPYV